MAYFSSISLSYKNNSEDFFFFNQGVYGWILQDCVLVEIVRKVILHIQFSMKMVHHFHSILKGVSGLIVLHRLSTVMGF